MVCCTHFSTFIVISFYLSSYTALGKLPSLNTNGHTSKRLDDCGACEVLTKSFSHWLEKTSRGKFEGGDAYWEENKLKSYSRSEIRLVEIQEGLCSERKKHKDECYSLAEEAEHPIEKWWVDNDPAAADLYTWLCIDTLAHCCPVGHFGPDCVLCAHSNGGRPCGGRGKCSGDGTRKGTGKCRCSKGYAGEACEQCAHDHYQSSSPEAKLECAECDASCELKDGCKTGGPQGCRTCARGWAAADTGCVDVNECAHGEVCAARQYCVNTLGSHQCLDCDKSCDLCTGPGSAACVSCREGYSRDWNGACSDTKLTTVQMLIVPALGLIASIFYTLRKTRIVYAFVILLISVYWLYHSGNTAGYRKLLYPYSSIENILNLFHYR